MGGLSLYNNQLYGFPSYNSGIVFKLNMDGSGLTTIYTFSGGVDGASPQGNPIISARNVCGITQFGGDNSSRAIFKITIP